MVLAYSIDSIPNREMIRNNYPAGRTGDYAVGVLYCLWQVMSRAFGGLERADGREEVASPNGR